MSPALNESSAIGRFKHSDAIEIRDGITLDFYTGMPLILFGGLMRGIKIPLQDFALKIQGGGLMREVGGVFAGHHGISLQKQIGCFNLRVVTMVAEELKVQWL